MSQTNGKVGRPKTGRKQYGSIRVDKMTAVKVNALCFAIDPTDTKQDDVVNKGLDLLVNTLDDEQRSDYNVALRKYMKGKGNSKESK